VLEAARGVRTHDDLVMVLDRIAGMISEALSHRTVVISLHRLAWNDFETITVHAPPETRRALLGRSRKWEQWSPYLTERFERRGAYHVPSGSVPDERLDGTFYIPPAPRSQSLEQWDPDDMLAVVMTSANGDVLGVVAIDEPVDGLRPGDDDIDRLVTMAEIASLAAEQALEARHDAEHRAALERLLSVSSRIAGQRSRDGVLDAVCAGIHDALGFRRATVLLADEQGSLRPAATAGWALRDPVFADYSFTTEQLKPIMQPANERHGCYLMDPEHAETQLHLRPSVHRSQSGGCAPYGWDHHWLLVPLFGSDHEPCGFVWVDDPADCLLPSREKLQALRLFADQASAALQAASDFEATSRRADHDPLTGLANRDTLSARLRQVLQRVQHSIAVLFIDLDNFKQVNDSLGHAAGDELLCTIALQIGAALRPGDTVARFGGDEFVALCEDVSGSVEAMRVAERLREALARPVWLTSGTVIVTASIGVVFSDEPVGTVEAVLAAADHAMYEAKAAGRDAARLATPRAAGPGASIAHTV